MNKKQLRIIEAAKDGNRIVANSKTIWAGLGNRSGLHSYADTLIYEKWKKSGSRFEKKVEKLSCEKIEIQQFRNINRDRGRWITVEIL